MKENTEEFRKGYDSGYDDGYKAAMSTNETYISWRGVLLCFFVGLILGAFIP